MNMIELVGRITNQPELKKANETITYARFCLAVKRKGTKDTTDFIDCVAWQKTAEILTQYCKKGQMLGVTGALQTQTYEKDGNKRKAYEVYVQNIEMLGGNPQDQKPAKQEPEPQPAPDSYEDLPFPL